MSNIQSKFSLPTYQLLQKIPKGKVVTYLQIAKVINCKSPRLIGKILHQNPFPQKYPCYKVVNAQGKVSSKYVFGGKIAQIKALEADGIEIFNDKVNLKKFQWINK